MESDVINRTSIKFSLESAFNNLRSFAWSWSVDEADELYERLSWALFGGTGGPRTRKKHKITNKVVS